MVRVRTDGGKNERVENYEQIAHDNRADGERADASQSRSCAWETPKLEDVSEQVMAQPYIRFT